MSQEQINKLMSLINAANVKESYTSSIAGITFLTSISMNKNNWIIDSGAMEHITPYAKLLHDMNRLPTPYTVILLNGNQV